MSVRVAVPLVVSALLAAAPAPLAAQYARLAASLDSLEAKATRDSLDPTAQYDVGVGYWMDRRYDDAERAFRRALAIDPKKADAYLALAYLPYMRRPKLWEEEEKGKVKPADQPAVDESNRFFRRAFLIDPMVDLKIYGLLRGAQGRVYVYGLGAGYLTALINGFENFYAGQYPAAYDFFDRALARTPAKDRDKKAPEGLLWFHGLAAAHVSEYQTAAADFRILLERALEREKTDSVVRFTRLASNDLRYMLAAALQRGGQVDEAVALYREVLTDDVGLYMAHVQLAVIHEQKRRWGEAVLERQRAVDTNPDDPSLVFDLGTTLAKARRFDEAATELRRAMQLNPSNARIPHTLAQVQLLLGDRAGARSSLERFVATAPSLFAPQVREARAQLATLQ